MALEIDMRPGKHITETKNIDILACAYLMLEAERDEMKARYLEASRQLGEAWALLTPDQWTTLLGREVDDDGAASLSR